jgi:hypothetical protein
MAPILENIIIMVLTIVVLVGGAYLVLVILDWGLKIKTGSREQEGLTNLWVAAQKDAPSDPGIADGIRDVDGKLSDDAPKTVDPTERGGRTGVPLTSHDRMA